MYINNIVYNDHHSDHPRELNAYIHTCKHMRHYAQVCKMNSIMQSVRISKLFMHLLNM